VEKVFSSSGMASVSEVRIHIETLRQTAVKKTTAESLKFSRLLPTQLGSSGPNLQAKLSDLPKT
jgi:hypothetical protein